MTEVPGLHFFCEFGPFLHIDLLKNFDVLGLRNTDSSLSTDSLVDWGLETGEDTPEPWNDF